MAKLDDWVRMRISMPFLFSSPPRAPSHPGPVRSRSYQNGYQPAGRGNSTAPTEEHSFLWLPARETLACCRNQTPRRGKIMSFKVTQTALLTLPQGPEYQFAAVNFEATDQLTIRSEQGHAAARRSGVPKFLSFPTTTESYTTKTTTTTASRHEGARLPLSLTCGHQEV